MVAEEPKHDDNLQERVADLLAVRFNPHKSEMILKTILISVNLFSCLRLWLQCAPRSGRKKGSARTLMNASIGRKTLQGRAAVGVRGVGRGVAGPRSQQHLTTRCGGASKACSRGGSEA